MRHQALAAIRQSDDSCVSRIFSQIICWRTEGSNPEKAPLRSVTYCDHWDCDPHMPPRPPGFTTRFATREWPLYRLADSASAFI
jgi:hypothetical protein